MNDLVAWRNPTRVLFLDWDGVLVSNGYYRRKYGPGLLPLVTLDDRVDPAAVALVNRIVQATQCQVVLTSLIRYEFAFPDLRQALVRAGLEAPVRFKLETRRPRRGQEIDDWLADHPSVQHYAIADDNVETNSHPGRWVEVYAADGLTEREADECIAVLLGQRLSTRRGAHA